MKTSVIRKRNVPDYVEETKIIYCCLMAACAFLNMSPYFTWTDSKIVQYFYEIFLPAITVFVGLFCGSRNVSKSHMIATSLFIVFGLMITLRNMHSISGIVYSMAIYVLGASFVFQDSDTQVRVFNLYCKIFAISLVPAMVIFCVKLLNISIPFKTVYSATNALKVANGQYYEQYLGSVFYRSPTSVRVGFCGMLDEPGAIGTFAGLFLVARGLSLKKTDSVDNIKLQNNGKKTGLRISTIDVLLLVGGLLSQSKAFIIIIAVALLYKQLIIGKLKGFVRLLLIGLFIYLMLNVDTGSPAIHSIQLMVKDTINQGTLSTNRAGTIGFNAAFETFLRSGSSKVLFGNGLYSSQNVSAFFGSAEIRMLIYDIGFVGFTFFILWMILSVRTFNFVPKKLWTAHGMFVIAFLLSMYQRQYVMKPAYLILLFGGCAYLSAKELKKDEYKSKIDKKGESDL